MKKFNAVGANIFAGGFTLGVSKYFHILAHLEHDDYGVEVTRANFKHPVFIGTETWPEKANKPIHFLYANPPCAIWSLAGNMIDRRDWRQDPRLQRVKDIFSLIERYRPQVWCWESVCQAFEKGRPFVEELAALAAKLGYSASYVLIDAQYLRAPQTRKRFFLVLHRVAIDWAKATPDFAAPPLLPRDVLKGIVNEPHLMPPPKGKYIERDLFKLVKPGERFRAAFDKLKGAVSEKDRPRNSQGKVIGRPGFLKVRLHPDKQVGVIFGDSTFHHKEDRLLSMNELSALHGFPPSFKWLNHRDGKTMIPRGVLPPVGEWLAKQVVAAIAANRKLAKPTRTLVDFRRAPGTIQGVLALPGGVDLNWKPEQPVRPAKGVAQRASEPTKPVRAVRTPPGGKSNKIKDLAQPVRKPGKSPIRIKDLGDVRRASSEILAGLRRGVRPASSGALIRARILEGKLDDDAMAAEVRKLWTGRTTSKADVAWNRGRLRKAGAL